MILNRSIRFLSNNIYKIANKQIIGNKKPVDKSNESRVFTIPNVLTATRIATTPCVGYFICNGMHNHALAYFAFAATTDLLDGFIARTFNQKSDLGAVLDPIADKLLITTCLVAMYNCEMMPLWIVKTMVFRDLAILFGGGVIRYMGFTHQKPTFKKFFDFKNYPTLGFEPTLLSKCNTALQCLLILTHLSTSHMAGDPIYDWSLFSFQVVTGITTTSSLAQYVSRIIMMNPMDVRLPTGKQKN